MQWGLLCSEPHLGRARRPMHIQMGGMRLPSRPVSLCPRGCKSPYKQKDSHCCHYILPYIPPPSGRSHAPGTCEYVSVCGFVCTRRCEGVCDCEGPRPCRGTYHEFSRPDLQICKRMPTGEPVPCQWLPSGIFFPNINAVDDFLFRSASPHTGCLEIDARVSIFLYARARRAHPTLPTTFK